MIDGEDDEQVEIETDELDEETDGDVIGEQAAKLAEGKDDDGDELVVEIEGVDDVDLTSETADETLLQRKLRHLLRDEKREKLALRAEVDALKAASAPRPVEVGKKPDRWEDDFESDDAYDKALRAYDQRVAVVEAQQKQQTEFVEGVAKAKRVARDGMRAGAAKITKQDFGDVEATIASAFGPDAAEILAIACGDQAPAVALALHAHPDLLNKLAKTAKDDPYFGSIKLIAALGKLSGGVKMVPKRKTGAQAEEIIRGSAPLSGGSSDKTLEKLEKEAARNGNDRSKIAAYKAELAKKQRAA